MQACAKINLHLHITERAENGYHLLDSLVVFTSLCDDIKITPSDTFKLTISGNDDLSAHCAEDDNLITRVTHLLAEKIRITPKVHIELQKHIPLAGGLGGGSADAAATLHLLKKMWNIPSDNVLESVAASLGSDIVACLHNQAVVMRQTGNSILPAPHMPKLYGVLVNPNIPCPTQEVYKTYAKNLHSFSQNIIFPDQFESAKGLCEFLNEHTQNDLTAAAIKVTPVVQTVLDELEKLSGVLLSRLSGSGATCFAIFDNAADAQKNSLKIKADHPNWWADAVIINQN